ncbi:MAG: aminotransferase class V-fold PLP-dependent enzyme, partial [Candidatus Binatia bacterium]
MYQQPATASQEEIVDTLVKAVQPRTRVVAVTWVHSSTGVKLPIRRMAEALATINATRSEADRVLLCVDGVHGFGVENVHLADLGCDFFIAGCHKGIFGPRGTGLVWGKPEAWPLAPEIIPSFSLEAYRAWLQKIPSTTVS